VTFPGRKIKKYFYGKEGEARVCQGLGGGNESRAQGGVVAKEREEKGKRRPAAQEKGEIHRRFSPKNAKKRLGMTVTVEGGERNVSRNLMEGKKEDRFAKNGEKRVLDSGQRGMREKGWGGRIRLPWARRMRRKKVAFGGGKKEKEACRKSYEGG